MATEEADRTAYFDVGRLPVNTSPKQVERIHDAIREDDVVIKKQEGISTREWLRDLGLRH